jgi:hypothetical protein
MGTANSRHSTVTQLQGIPRRREVARARIGSDVVQQRERTGIGVLQAELYQAEQRVHHQEDQCRGQHDPQDHQRIEGAPAHCDDRHGMAQFGLAHLRFLARVN